MLDVSDRDHARYNTIDVSRLHHQHLIRPQTTQHTAPGVCEMIHHRLCSRMINELCACIVIGDEMSLPDSVVQRLGDQQRRRTASTSLWWCSHACRNLEQIYVMTILHTACKVLLLLENRSGL